MYTDAEGQQHRRKAPTGASTWRNRRKAPTEAPTGACTPLGMFMGTLTLGASSTDGGMYPDGQHRRGHVPRRKAPTGACTPTEGTDERPRRGHVPPFQFFFQGTDAKRPQHRRGTDGAPTGHVHPWACTWEHRRWAPAAPTQSASSTDGQHRRGHVPRRKAPTEGTDARHRRKAPTGACTPLGMYMVATPFSIFFQGTDAKRPQHRRRTDGAPTGHRRGTDGAPTGHRRGTDGAPTAHRRGTDGAPTGHRRGMYTLGHVHGNTDAGRQQHRRRAPAAPTDSTDGGMYTTGVYMRGHPF
ncbi:hypothetical protein FCM35_KLT21709 [Carex littledalei]|uniref:Uncharacterized protein n=1 Tax=Carex littledalei TaxID=544730 RepID=A0A833QUY9_9POAL|nr:hypothetical protein FCM35_KLT21709 [Carex littledalei]